MLLSLVISHLCFSQVSKSHTISQGIGTSGLITTYNLQLHKKISIGISGSYLGMDLTVPITIAGEKVKATLQTNTLQGATFICFHPFGKKDSTGFSKNGFFISGGLAQRKSSNYNVSFTFRDPLKIGEFNLTSDQTGSVNISVVTQTSLAFLSLGYEKKIKKTKWSLITEAGLYQHGLPVISMNSTGVLKLNDRNKDQIQQNISSLRYFPLINISLGYKL